MRREPSAPTRTRPSAGSKKVISRRSPWLVLLLLVFLLAAGSEAAGQAAALNRLSGGSERPAVPQVVDEEEIVRTAIQSFEDSAKRLSGELAEGRSKQDSVSPERLEHIVERAVSRFSETARLRISELKGDGALTLMEVTEALSKLREQRLADVEERLLAALDGIAAPPTLDEVGTLHHYLGELLSYTILQRNALHRWFMLLGFILAGLLAAGAASLGLRRVESALKKRQRPIAAELLASITGPLYLTAALIGVSMGLGWIWVPVEIADLVWFIIQLLFAVSVFWLLWNMCGVLGSVVGWAAEQTQSRLDNQMVRLIRKGLRLFVLIVFVLFVAETMFNTDIKGFLAGLGILGIAVSLAAQDTLKNFLASLTIFGEKPFAIGDLVRFQGHFGPIEEIGFRSTRLRTLDGHLVTIPNATLIRDPVENVGVRPSIRRRFRIDLPYATQPDKVREALEILSGLLSAREHQPKDQPPRFVFERFGPYSLRLLVQYHYEPPDYWEALEHDTEINLAIMERFSEAGLKFAFPTQTLVHETDQDAPPLRIQSDERRREPAGES